MDNQYIYVMFSSTPNRIGRMIRKVTGEVYNHASIALDENLDRMYSFARRFYHTPLYGGFVKETRSRYHQNGQASQVCVCRVAVTPEQYQALEAKLDQMYEDQNDYLYNHLSALSALFHKRTYAKNALTCVEFCVGVLHDLGVDVDLTKHYTVEQIHTLLSADTVYAGPIPAGEPDDAFYAKKPIPHPIYTTLRDMGKLIPRLGK